MAENKIHWPEIAQIGGYPPPYGGISVHLQRLVERLEKEGADFKLYSISGNRPPHVVTVARGKLSAALWFIRFCLRHKCKIIHLHIPNWYMRLVFGMVARWRKGKYVMSIQGRSISVALRKPKSIRARLTRWYLHQMDAIIACNPEIEYKCLEQAGLPREKVWMIPAFIPPDPNTASAPPEYVQDFINTHNPLLSAVGWIGQEYRGQDLYGIDMMTELVDRLRADYPNIGIVLSVNGGEEEAIRQTCRTSQNRVGEKILFITEELDDISRIVQASQLFVRPTNTDGDAVSVREALCVGTPVVASDAVPRPESCVIFPTRDMDEFEAKVKWSLERLSELRREVSSHKIPDNADKIMRIYSQLRRKA